MRALRTSFVAFAAAGALLAPAAGTVLAAGGAGAGTVRGTVSEVPADDSRYLGRAVPIGNGLVAVLRNDGATGPEAWIRYVGPDWTPGETYMVRVVGLLDARHPRARIGGLELALVRPGSGRPVLEVTKGGVTKAYALPPRGSDLGRGCVSQVRRTDLGAGVFADLTTSTTGPQALLYAWAAPAKAFATLDREHPSLPDSAGFVVRITGAGSRPVLEWKTQGGPAPYGHQAFPALPEGCRGA
ncbi:hypothetical protein [Streptomyces sp. NRRL S-87]|uniref:hypothetical protein n=1 Tax=Streptomyces sp. NRRL S-87 TaxID=1463920 RepID=UPI0004BEC421|nr:hypothetical protein [Streptomyces sp. NRRL S-87]